MNLSIIIPVLNEANNLEVLMPFFLYHEMKNEFEVIVVDGGSEDYSVEIVKKWGVQVMKSNQKSRSSQMNLGAKQALGEILYFVHADTRVLPSFFADITKAVAGGIPSGCFAYSFDSNSWLLKVTSWFTKFNSKLSGGGDQTLFVKREVFEALGGFDEYFCIMEDFDLVRRLRKSYSFHVIPKKITVSARKFETNSWLRVQLVNLLVFAMFFLKTPPKKIKRLYSKLLDYRI